MTYLRASCFLLLLLGSGFTYPAAQLKRKWEITEGGSLMVAGSTNVNKFSCVINKYAMPETLFIDNDTGDGPVKVSGSLTLDIESFDCHNRMMTRDLRKTLKAKDFPQLVIHFISLDRYPKPGSTEDAVKGLVDIELAGVTRRFGVDYRFLSAGNKSITFTGTRQVNFSDFNLVPPRKMGGMIKAKQELDITFNLVVNVSD